MGQYKTNFCDHYSLTLWYTICIQQVNHFTRYGMDEQFISDDIDLLKKKNAQVKEQSFMDDIDFQRVSFLSYTVAR